MGSDPMLRTTNSLNLNFYLPLSLFYITRLDKGSLGGYTETYAQSYYYCGCSGEKERISSVHIYIFLFSESKYQKLLRRK